MRTLLLSFPLVALAACSMGPDYAGPAGARAPQPPAAFVRAPSEARAEAPAVADWWTQFSDPVLDALEARLAKMESGSATKKTRKKKAAKKKATGKKSRKTTKKKSGR